jgi:hypothetical protein
VVVAVLVLVSSVLVGCEAPSSCEAAIGLAFINEPVSVRIRMQRIAWRESRNQPAVVNGSGHTGCLQLSRIHAARAARLGFSWVQMRQAWPNAVVAYDLWREQGWRPWSIA